MSIFKAYDIRGIYPTEIDEKTAHKIGQAMVCIFNAKTVVVARDCRISSPLLSKAVIEGAIEQGADVIDVGLCSSPMFYFCTGNINSGAGILATASHNPKEYNGFKLTKNGAVAISGDTGIKDVERLVTTDAFPKSGQKGSLTKRDMLSAYADHVLTFARKIKNLKVVADAGGGMAGLVCPPVFSRLPINVTKMWFELDGTFSNRNPNPLKDENITALIETVKREKADIGVAFDGDADRAIFVDDNGDVLRSDLATALIAEEVAASYPNSTMLYDLRSSKALKEHLDSLGIKSIKTRVGHSFIKAKMRENNAVFAGELSGHFYFREHYFCDSALIATIFMLNLLSRTGKKLSVLAKPLRKYATTGEVNFTVKDAKSVLEEAKKTFSDAKIEELDGVTAEYPNWWFNLRMSNTEPLVRMIVEANDQKTLDAGRARVEEVIKKSFNAALRTA